MNLPKYHILNGDALKERFPKKLGGEIIVLRECMVEGEISGDTPSEVFESRKEFFNKAYQIPVNGYYSKSQLEIERILSIPNHSEVTLWFEDDLFCQTNLWFTMFLLLQKQIEKKVYLVRPNTSLLLGFSGFDQNGLVNAFDDRVELIPDDLHIFNKFWKLHQGKQYATLKKFAGQNSKKFPFLYPAIEALINLYPEQGLGEPHRIIMKLIQIHGRSDFGKIFRSFIEQAPIYGFGDMQVKRIFDEMTHHES